MELTYGHKFVGSQHNPLSVKACHHRIQREMGNGKTGKEGVDKYEEEEIVDGLEESGIHGWDEPEEEVRN